MAREYLRPFTKAVTINDAAANTVELRDSAGNLMDCNYVTVEAVSGNGNSFFLATLSGVNVGMGATDYLANSMNGIASGVNGLASNNNGGSVVFGLSHFDSVQAVVISQAAADTVTYLVSYGNVTLSNQVADAQAPRGG